MPSTKAEAHAALKTIMVDKEFGTAGDELVIEEFLEGILTLFPKRTFRD